MECIVYPNFCLFFCIRYEKLSKYLVSHMHQHRSWALRFFICELLNLIVAILSLSFLDWVLGGEFMKYGSKVNILSNNFIWSVGCSTVDFCRVCRVLLYIRFA